MRQIDPSICERCHGEYCQAVVQVPDWIEERQTIERTGVLACPYVFQGVYEALTNIDKPPPKWCPFRLEHMMSLGKENGSGQG